MYRLLSRTIIGLAWLAPGVVGAQTVPDQLDPALVKRSLPPIANQTAPLAPAAPTTTPPDAARVASDVDRVTAHQILVTGSDDMPAREFDAVTAAYRDRPLSHADLGQLAGTVADVARRRGYVFASGSIAAQPLTDGTLVVTLDDGRVDAVRSIGQSNAAADRILARLVTHRAVTRAQLERAIALVGDLPGVRVANTRYMRQNGFGILLVTLVSDRAMVYAQLDNRGTAELGRLRATALVDLRGGLTQGDDIGIVAATTPEHPRQFAFVSARYTAPVGADGGAAYLTGYYGRTHAGGDLAALDLIGHSYGGAVGYSAAILRSPRSSLWFDTEVLTLASNQSVLGQRFRKDAMTVLSGTLKGAGQLAGGSYHANLAVSWGMPLPGMTKAGDPLASRNDGSARFVTSSVQADWTRVLKGPLSLALSAVAQLASRPLLASAQISLGGPGFGRAYDYSERTGDQGVLGSAEMRLDLQKLHLPLVSRTQLYAFVDGGVVRDLRDDFGDGSLSSTGAGLRLGRGALDGSFEIAFPLNATMMRRDDRPARLSGQVSAHF